MTNPFDERAKKAVDAVSELAKQLITLSTGVVTVTISFGKDVFGTRTRGNGLVMAGWCIYLVCIVAGIWVLVGERADDTLDNYAMVDPLGRFRQARADGYVVSAPITHVGVERAWAEVGGCDLARFHSRGGEYEDGEPCRPNPIPIIAIEGFDGSGKSTVVRELAARMPQPPRSSRHSP